MDDQQIVREGLKRIIEFDPALTVSGGAEDGGGATLARIKALRPQVVLSYVGYPH